MNLYCLRYEIESYIDDGTVNGKRNTEYKSVYVVAENPSRAAEVHDFPHNWDGSVNIDLMQKDIEVATKP